jgi:hypothetical protein
LVLSAMSRNISRLRSSAWVRSGHEILEPLVLGGRELLALL